MYFHYFVIISPWKRARPFIWTNLNPLHPRMLCGKFGWNWPGGSGEEDENVKSLRRQRQQQQQQRQRRQRRTTDKFWSEKLTWAFGSGELKMECLSDRNLTMSGPLTLWGWSDRRLKDSLWRNSWGECMWTHPLLHQLSQTWLQYQRRSYAQRPMFVTTSPSFVHPKSDIFNVWWYKTASPRNRVLRFLSQSPFSVSSVTAPLHYVKKMTFTVGIQNNILKNQFSTFQWITVELFIKYWTE